MAVTGQLHSPSVLSQGETNPLLVEYEALGLSQPRNIQTNCVPKPIWTFWGRRKKILVHAGNRTPDSFLYSNHRTKTAAKYPSILSNCDPIGIRWSEVSLLATTETCFLHSNAGLDMRSSTQPWEMDDTCALQSCNGVSIKSRGRVVSHTLNVLNVLYVSKCP